jgi:transposase
VYEKTGSISKAARKCGIARSTLQRWLKRYQLEGLSDRSRRPHHLARKKWEDEVENLVLEVRDKYRYGKLRICWHLQQHHNLKVSASTVARILKKYEKGPLKRFSKQRTFTRYSKDLPGERVQLDVCQIDTSLYQYTAIDDCTRYRVLHTYSKRTAKTQSTSWKELLNRCLLPSNVSKPTEAKSSLPTAFKKSSGSILLSSAPSSLVPRI